MIGNSVPPPIEEPLDLNGITVSPGIIEIKCLGRFAPLIIDSIGIFLFWNPLLKTVVIKTLKIGKSELLTIRMSISTVKGLFFFSTYILEDCEILSLLSLSLDSFPEKYKATATARVVDIAEIVLIIES